MKYNLLIKIVFLSWISVITVFSVLPHPQDDNNIIDSYKLTKSGAIIHFVAYFIAAGLCYVSYRRDGFKFIVLTGLIVFLYSALLEIIQLFLSYRSFNVYDILANLYGIIFFVFPLTFYKIKLKHLNERKPRLSE